MKIYSRTYIQDPAENMKFITYMNKLLGKDLWILVQVHNYDYGYYVKFIRTYIHGSETRVVSRSIYIDDLEDEVASLEINNYTQDALNAISSETQIFGDYDLALTQMTDSFKIYEPVSILSTEDILDICIASQD